MADRNTEVFFRTSMNGYRKQDVNAYIEKLGEQRRVEAEKLTQENEHAKKQITALQNELADSRTTLEDAAATLKASDEAREAAEAELCASRSENERLNSRLAELQSELESLRTEGETLRAENAAMVREREKQVEAENDLNSRVGEIIRSAKETAEEIGRKADQEAEQIRAKAVRDAALIQIQGKTQREDVSNLIDKQILSVLSADMDAYENKISAMLVGLSTAYKTLSQENNDLCEALLRKRPEQIAQIRESILRSLELHSTTDIESSPDAPAES